MGTKRIPRLLQLVTLLQSGSPLSENELLDDLQISRRTLYRDLRALSTAGIPWNHKHKQGFRIAQSFFLPPSNLTISEIIALMTLNKEISAQPNRVMAQPGQSAIRKLLSTIPQPIMACCNELMDNTSTSGSSAATNKLVSVHFTALLTCIQEARACRINYLPPEQKPIRCDFHPFRLHFDTLGWHVLGETCMHTETISIHLNRIESLAVTDRKFQKPTQFKIPNSIYDAAKERISRQRQKASRTIAATRASA